MDDVLILERTVVTGAGLDEALVRSMMEGISEASPWSSFVAHLRRTMGANYANVIFRRADAARSYEVCDADGPPSDLRQRYYEAFSDKDPIDYYEMESGRAYLIEEFLTEGRGDEFYSKFLKPAGMSRFLICHVGDPQGVRAWLSVTRPETDAPFGSADRAALESIGRCFTPALSLFGALEKAGLELSVHARATRAMALGVLFLDQSGKIIAIDAEARHKLRRQTVLYVDKGGLRLRDRALDKALSEILSGFLDDAGDGERSISMRIGGEAQLELMVCAVRPDQGHATARASPPHVCVYLRSELETSSISAERVAQLFHLGRREAELAALLAQGSTLTEAAGILMITEATARTYSKRIFDKIGVRRQTELVRRIVTSMASLSAETATSGSLPRRDLYELYTYDDSLVL